MGWTKTHSQHTDEMMAWAWFSTQYPALSTYLNGYIERAKSRSDQGEFWWELRPCDYYGEFEKPKIVWAKYGISPAFTYDTGNYYIVNTVFIAATQEKWLVGILNSKLMQFYATQKFNLVRGGYIEWIPQNVSPLPITLPTSEQRDKLEQLVEKMLALKEQLAQTDVLQDRHAELEADIRALDKRIDALVYQLYGLTEDEIRLVEGTG